MFLIYIQDVLKISDNAATSDPSSKFALPRIGDGRKERVTVNKATVTQEALTIYNNGLLKTLNNFFRKTGQASHEH